MKLAISSGHSTKCQGMSSAWLNEVEQATRVVDRVGEILNAAGVETWTFHDTVSTDKNECLNRICSWHNARPPHDYDISVHFNAGGGQGCEVWYLTQQSLANKVSAAMAAAGHLKDRGPKYTSSLYFLNKTAMPSVLLEVVFGDSKSDCDLYYAHFEAICHAIAESLLGAEIGDTPPPEEELPPEPYVPDDRPLIGVGDYGYNVVELQTCLGIDADGDFGNQTKAAVQSYQAAQGLSVDGLVGGQTWGCLKKDFGLPEYPPPLPPMFSDDMVEDITTLAINHPIARYNWSGRGQAPAGYTKGIAVAYAQAYVRYTQSDPIAKEMAKANTGNDAVDALSWYNSNFAAIGLDNSEDGIDTLRHLFVLLMGLGMRESSGQHCCGRDMSASNTASDTCEAGLFQSSWNFSTCCTDIVNLFDQYDMDSSQGYMSVFAESVSCSSSDWSCYGSGDGYRYQKLAKYNPVFACESTAVGLRNIRKHWGPINERAAEIRREADDMLWQIQRLIDES
jgi:peptidoglycan hydrolase-like protein with peptidoglycan-binding domain